MNSIVKLYTRNWIAILLCWLLLCSSVYAAPRVGIIIPEFRAPFNEIFDAVADGVDNKLRDPVARLVLQKDYSPGEITNWLRANNISSVIALGSLGKKAVVYMPKNMPTDQLAEFMNKTVMGRVDIEGLKPIRDFWKGSLVIKGLINQDDVAAAISLGADAVVISNHGARQLDVGESPVEPLQRAAAKYGKDIKIFMDSGLRSGTNVASALACGADFTFSRLM